jgi:hypothetical protein
VTVRRLPPPNGDGRDRPLRLRPAVLVPLSAEQERQAVDSLAGMLAGLLGRQIASRRHSGEGTALHELDVPDDDEAA